MLCRNSIERVAAALQYSDNTAANLLLDQIGGPSSLQAALHGLVDTATHDDIAIAWPPAGAPLVIAIESDRRTQNATSADALIADATKAGLAALN